MVKQCTWIAQWSQRGGLKGKASTLASPLTGRSSVVFGEKNPPVRSRCFPSTVLVWLYLHQWFENRKVKKWKYSPLVLCILQRLPSSVFKPSARCSCPRRPIEPSTDDQGVVHPVGGVPLHGEGQGVQAALAVGRPKLHKVHRNNTGVVEPAREKKS